MAGPNDFTGQNIQDTYQRVLQVSSSGQITDGTGSLVLLDTNAVASSSFAVTASFAVSASHEITFELSSSHAQTADTASFVDSTTLDTFKTTGVRSGDGFIDGNITASGDISSSGTIIANKANIIGDVSASTVRIKKQNAEAKLALEASSQAYQSSIDFSQGGIGDLWRVGVTNSSLFKPNFVITSGSSSILGLNNDQSFIIKGDEFKVGVGFPISSGQPTSPDLLAKFNVNGDILTSGSNGHITASGHISASGTGSFPGLEVDGYITHTGDTNTYFGFTAADTWEVFTGGGEMIQINSTGTTFNVSGNDRDFKVSGNGGNLFILNDGSNRAVFPTITEFRIGLADSTSAATLEVAGNISATGSNAHITASGNISASGVISGSNIVESMSTGTGNDVTLTLYDGTTFTRTINSISNAITSSNADCATEVNTQTCDANAERFITFVDDDNTTAACETVKTNPFLRWNCAKRVLIVDGKILTKGSDVAIESGSISMTGDLTITGSISSSGADASISVTTGSFNHVITDGDTIQFRNATTKAVEGNLTFDPSNGLSVKNADKSDDAPLKVKQITVGNQLIVGSNAEIQGDISASNYFIDSASAYVQVLDFSSTVNGVVVGSIKASTYYQAQEFHQYLTGNVIIGSTSTNFGGTAKLDVDGNIATDSHITASGQISSSGTGENYFGGDVNVIDADIILDNNKSINFKHATSGTEFGNIFMNTSNQMVFQNNKTNGDVLIKAGGAGVGNVIIMEGGTTNEIAKFGETDSLELTGNFTASGDISSSAGRFIGNGLTLKGNNYQYSVFDDPFILSLGSNSVGSSSHALRASDQRLVINSENVFNVEIEGNITASGNISASGQIQSADIITTRIIAGDNNTIVATTGINSLIFNTPITASGDISASSNILADNYLVDGQTALSTADNTLTGQVFVNNNTTKIELGKSNVNTSTIIHGNITASGDISSSLNGTVSAGSGSFHILKGDTTQATGLSVNGTITASGQISSSATITADAFIGTNIGTISKEFIPIVPQDFNMDNVPSTRDYAGYIADSAGGRVAVKLSGFSIFATKMIPKGFTAVSGSIYGSDTTNVLVWSSGSITESSNATISTDVIEATTGTGSAYSNGVVGDGLTYVTVKWTPGTSDTAFGGKIYIQPS